MKRIRENMKDYWVGILLGVFLISFSVVLHFVHDRKVIFTIMILVLGILFIIGSILKPRKSNAEPNEETQTDKPPLKEDEIPRLLAQYKENQENQRSQVRLIWEIPTIAILISSGFLLASYNPTLVAPDNTFLRATLLSLGSLLMFVAFLAVVKHRHFRGVWVEYSKRLENRLKLINIPMETNETRKAEMWRNTNFFHKFFLSFRAELWLANVLFLISMIFALLSIHYFYECILTL